MPKYLLSRRSLGYFYVLDAFLKKLRLLSRTPATVHVSEFCKKTMSPIYF